jgi:hypothetical protein
MKVLVVSEGPNELGGALQNLVRRLGMKEGELETDRVSLPSVHAHHGKGKGYFKRAVRWMLEAEKRGFEALILVIDQDGRPERTRELDDAQGFTGTAIHRALGVAIRTFDAWMLADERALTQVLEIPISRQSDPEAITDAKGVCNRLLDESDRSITPTAMYAAIANETDLGLLETRCPRGFGVFAGRVRALPSHVNGS